jgi:hypothetical protein
MQHLLKLFAVCTRQVEGLIAAIFLSPATNYLLGFSGVALLYILSLLSTKQSQSVIEA